MNGTDKPTRFYLSRPSKTIYFLILLTMEKNELKQMLIESFFNNCLKSDNTLKDRGTVERCLNIMFDELLEN